MDREEDFNPPHIWFVAVTWLWIFSMPGWWLLHSYEGWPSSYQWPFLKTSLLSCPVFLSFKLFFRLLQNSSSPYFPSWFPVKLETSSKEKKKLKPYLTRLGRMTSAHTDTFREVSKYTVPCFLLTLIHTVHSNTFSSPSNHFRELFV